MSIQPGYEVNRGGRRVAHTTGVFRDDLSTYEHIFKEIDITAVARSEDMFEIFLKALREADQLVERSNWDEIAEENKEKEDGNDVEKGSATENVLSHQDTFNYDLALSDLNVEQKTSDFLPSKKMLRALQWFEAQTDKHPILWDAGFTKKWVIKAGMKPLLYSFKGWIQSYGSKLLTGKHLLEAAANMDSLEDYFSFTIDRTYQKSQLTFHLDRLVTNYVPEGAKTALEKEVIINTTYAYEKKKLQAAVKVQKWLREDIFLRNVLPQGKSTCQLSYQDDFSTKLFFQTGILCKTLLLNVLFGAKSVCTIDSGSGETALALVLHELPVVRRYTYICTHPKTLYRTEVRARTLQENLGLSRDLTIEAAEKSLFHLEDYQFEELLESQVLYIDTTGISPKEHRKVIDVIFHKCRAAAFVDSPWELRAVAVIAKSQLEINPAQYNLSLEEVLQVNYGPNAPSVVSLFIPTSDGT